MATEPIGILVPTAIPGYQDAADIQAALRAYHYGSYTYDINETDPNELINPSIAWTINNLQDQIDIIDENAIKESVFTAKGDILSASASSTPLILPVGTNNQFLVVNNATATGLQWSNTLLDPVVSGLTLSDSSIIFEGSSSDSFETTLTVVNPTQDRTISIPDISGTLVTTGDTNTVTNTMLANSTISGVSLGSNLLDLTIGTGLTGTSYNGSTSITIAIDSSTVATLSETQTLTNKTLTGPKINLLTNAQTGTSYIVDISDNGKLITCDNNDPVVITVPLNSSQPFALGAQINIVQLGIGQVSISGDIGVNVYSTPGLKFRDRYSVATLIKIDTDAWLLTGDLSQ